jgi:hypothetical protein
LDEYSVNIEVTDKFTDDVRKCLRIFYEQTPDSDYSTIPDEWDYWFLKNPYGSGLYSIARDGTKIIGFCALIPIEMTVNNGVIRGAKAEFLFVLPEYRKRKAANLDKPVSVTLLKALYESSINYNFNLIFGVATKAAAKAHLAAGKKPMDLELLHYFTLFKPRKFREFNKLKAFLYKYGTYLASGLLRKRINKYNGTDFTVLKSIDDIENIDSKPAGNNALLYHDKKMLNFRFKNGDCLIYQINNTFKDYLIFSKPYSDGRVFLRHWSTLDLTYEIFAAVLKDLYNRCKRSGALSVNLVFSGVNNNLKIDFKKLGLMRRKSTDILLLYLSNPELNPSLNAKDWYFTDSHRGFI